MIGYSTRIEKIIRESAFDEKKKKPGLKFNPRLALTGLRTTGTGHPSLILRCESTGEFSFCLAIIFYACICTWTGQGIKIQISLG